MAERLMDVRFWTNENQHSTMTRFVVSRATSIISIVLYPFLVRGLQPTAAPRSTVATSFLVPPYYRDKSNNNDVFIGTYPSPLHSIHIQPILSDHEAVQCRQLACNYAAATGRWDQPDFQRHASYATCDFAVEDCESLHVYLNEIDFDDRMWNALSEKYGVAKENMSYMDFFCANYRAQGKESPETSTLDRLQPHRDGSILSFTVLLTPPEGFEGGGTFFDALRDVESSEPSLSVGGVVRPLRAGDATLHAGKLLHGADVVTKGERTVLVGFVDVADCCLREGVISTACRDWGRMDVANFRYKRQLERSGNGTARRGWFLNHSRWLLGASSAMTGFCPAFDSVERRTDSSFQRQRKLESEDALLRSILLDEPGSRPVDLFGGDFTVL